MTTAAIGDLSPLAIKCMEFCQALASQGTKFSFNLTTGPQFSFSLDTSESGTSTSVVAEQVKRKKWSPSDVRRNLRRRQEFLKRKTEGEKKDGSADETPAGNSVQSVLPTPEKERAPVHIADLVLSPIHGPRDDVDAMPSPLPTSFVCKRPAEGSSLRDLKQCGKTFNHENDLRRHAHKDHDYCFQHQFQGECPRPCLCEK